MPKALSLRLTISIFLAISLAALTFYWQSHRKASTQALPQTQPVKPSGQGYVLRVGEGEALRRGEGNTITIKVDPKTGSPTMAVGTQVLKSGAGIPIHMHEHEDEVLFVHDGAGAAVLEGQRKTLEKGDTIFVPHGVWHGIETKGDGISLLWVVTPPGLEDFFRDTSSPVGAPTKGLTPAQTEEIGRKHGVRFKPR